MQQSDEHWAEIQKFRVSIASVSLYCEPYLELSRKHWPLILLIQFLTSEIIISNIFDSRERKITSDSFAEFTNYNQQNKNTFRNFRIYIYIYVCSGFHSFLWWHHSVINAVVLGEKFLHKKGCRPDWNLAQKCTHSAAIKLWRNLTLVICGKQS